MGECETPKTSESGWPIENDVAVRRSISINMPLINKEVIKNDFRSGSYYQISIGADSEALVYKPDPVGRQSQCRIHDTGEQLTVAGG